MELYVCEQPIAHNLSCWHLCFSRWTLMRVAVEDSVGGRRGGGG